VRLESGELLRKKEMERQAQENPGKQEERR
jgi:hypothetical protein